MEKVNLAEAFARIHEHWTPKLVGKLNGQAVKLSKLSGEFIWHHHEAEDELFLVVRGRLRLEFRDGAAELEPGEMIIVPRGVEHRPVAKQEVEVLVFEPLGTRNTGNIEDPALTAPIDAPLGR